MNKAELKNYVKTLLPAHSVEFLTILANVVAELLPEAESSAQEKETEQPSPPIAQAVGECSIDWVNSSQPPDYGKDTPYDHIDRYADYRLLAIVNSIEHEIEKIFCVARQKYETLGDFLRRALEEHDTRIRLQMLDPTYRENIPTPTCDCGKCINRDGIWEMDLGIGDLLTDIKYCPNCGPLYYR